ncbi:CPBP family intramembrane glutamic endopeptidase [Ferruginibacter sp. HRS2-29]|uniref:CPBP family intramembrane glutamic endopeptidase n=1 Tax=Ferruginibacter sp. HRS2-29 TaxID=2487334 RepID=UPI0020CD36F1|nr:CPBP family intramembrane glutamic endopeptidase [Ferruginibacter sp. HRS2-29]MCP9753024.1 CPBP family intramembrane metalloprotease [Ferruginibacter sp. HRS2-29]
MKEDFSVVFKYIRSFAKGLKWLYLLTILAMMAGLIWLNYYGRLPKFYGSGNQWQNDFISSYLLYSLPFAAAYFLQGLFYNGNGYLKNKWLLLMLLFAPAIFALRVNFTLHIPLVKKIFQGDELLFWLKCTNWLIRAVFVILIVCFIALRNKMANVYSIKGLTNSKAYLLLIALMLPLIVIAGTQPSFLHTYPRAQVIAPLDIPFKPLRYLLFELSYAFDFISIEFFFRGFLIVTFIRICGMRCIIPAACFYCCIHFGKPMGEAISSFWGGMLLGIISYHTKNVWGGILVHIGVAMLMELTGSLAHVL